MEKSDRKKNKRINPEDLTEEDIETPVEETLAYKVMDELFMDHLKGNKAKHYPSIMEHL